MAARVELSPEYRAAWSHERIRGADAPALDPLVLDALMREGRLAAESNLERAERVTMAHINTLDEVFHHLLGSAFSSSDLDTQERLLRLAFRAQAQCSRTTETLAGLMNPALVGRQTPIGQKHQPVISNGSGAIAPSTKPPAAETFDTPMPAVPQLLRQMPTVRPTNGSARTPATVPEPTPKPEAQEFLMNPTIVRLANSNIPARESHGLD